MLTAEVEPEELLEPLDVVDVVLLAAVVVVAAAGVAALVVEAAVVGGIVVLVVAVELFVPAAMTAPVEMNITRDSRRREAGALKCRMVSSKPRICGGTVAMS